MGGEKEGGGKGRGGGKGSSDHSGGGYAGGKGGKAGGGGKGSYGGAKDAGGGYGGGKGGSSGGHGCGKGGGYDDGEGGSGASDWGVAGGGWNGGGGGDEWGGGGHRAGAADTSLSATAEKGQPKTVPLYDAQEDSRKRPKAPDFKELPAWSAAGEVKAACQRSQVICVQGETGCGKSSVLPMIFLDDPGARIAVTQPRRIAAISLAERVASTRGEGVGETVGYRVAMDGKVSDSTRLSFVTTGWLLMYLAHRPDALRRYTHIVLDEIHERDLDMDLLCLLLKRSLANNPKLRLVLMSATVDATQFLNYFRSPGVRTETGPIVVGSRRFPTYPFFLDDLASGALQGFTPKVRMDRFEKVGGRVDVNPQLFDVCVGIVHAVAQPGICVLIFLPGLSEIEQLHEAFQFSAYRGCKLDYHMLHSVVPHERQRLALEPPPLGHCKVVLSTNIAESSLTIPDVRYILDFGIVRKMVYDEERAMQSLANTWSSQATCRQRRGRCGRLQEGVIIYLFPRSHYERLQPYASPEVLGVPLESIYLKSKVLLHHLGPPEELLSQLIDSPPRQRITSAAQNLLDLGALRKDGGVASLGRIAVFMPTTIQLTKLVVLSWALGIPADGIVIAAALSVQDVFKMASPANCRWAEEFPQQLAQNYIARAHHDAGQFSEPIMYRNLYMDYLLAPKAHGGKVNYKWLDDNCVAGSRMSQFTALVTELASKLGAAVPSAKGHPALVKLMGLKRSQQLSQKEVDTLFTSDYERLKFAIVGAFQPSFVQGEINTQNKNKGKINNCGFEPMKTCLLQQIKPPEMADVDNLWTFCASLAPVSNVKLNDTGKIAFIECGDDTSCGVPPSDVVHQMPLVAQLLHQLMRQRCKFQVLTDKGIRHEPSPIGSPNFLGGIKWHVNGKRTMGAPYNRSNMGYMCEMRAELKCHWGVCSSLLGREGPDQVRITGLTILPPPGSMTGTVMILALLSGPFHVTFLGEDSGYCGVQVVATDVEGETRPMVLSFAPGWWMPEDMRRLNEFRMAMNELLAAPEQDTADEASRRYEELMAAVRLQKADRSMQGNDFLPDADYAIRKDRSVPAEMIAPPYGSYELYQVGGTSPLPGRTTQRPGAFGAVEKEGAHATFRAAPAWLRSLSAVARHDLECDLAVVREKFGLGKAEVVEVRTHGLPVGLAVDIAGPEQAVDAARTELVEGILQYYATQVEWSAAELPAEPEAEPASRREAAATQTPEHPGVPSKRVWRAGTREEPAAEPAVKDWGEDTSPDSAWDTAPAAEEAEDGGGWPDAPAVVESEWSGVARWDRPEAGAGADELESAEEDAVPGLRKVLCKAGLSHCADAICAWARDEGAATLEEVLENTGLVSDWLELGATERHQLDSLRVSHGV